MTVFILLLLFYTANSKLDPYDDDICLPIPSSILIHSPINNPDMHFLAKINNCICKENPNNYVVCSGHECKQFPRNLTINATPLFKLQLTAISDLKNNDFSSISNVDVLEIEANIKLVRIEPGCFRNLSKLRNLTLLSNTNLKMLEPNVFMGLINLEYIFLIQNGFTKVLDVSRSIAPKYLPRLELLSLSENTIHEINQNEFYPMNGTPLNQLNLHLCQIEYIHPDCLEPLKNLTVLRLGQNLFNNTVIERLLSRTIEFGIPLNMLNLHESGLKKNGVYPLCQIIAKSNITYVHLSKNHLDYVNDNMFPLMEKLTSIDLRDDLISHITPKAFQNIPNLKTLYLGENILMGILEGVLLQTLTELDLSANSNEMYSPGYFNINGSPFKNMHNLKNLKLSYNTIRILYKSAFEGLANLTKLNLKNANLIYIENGIFEPLENLKVLNIIDNPFPKMMNVTAYLFKGLQKLEILLFGGCSLQNLTTVPSLFTFTPNLIYLNLERNKIHAISPDQLTHLKNLQTLILNENALAYWKVKILPQKNLKNLSIKQNKLTYITKSMLEEWKFVEVLELDGNPFSCDCSFYEIIHWLNHNKMRIKLDRDHLIANCIGPQQWQKVSILTYIDYLKQHSAGCEENFIFNKTTILTTLICVSSLFLFAIFCYIFRWHMQYCIIVLKMQKIKFLGAGKAELFSNKHNNTSIYDAFVSYCNEDRDFVMKMVNILENQKPIFNLCVYERDFQIGNLISVEVKEKMIASRMTVLVISDAFAKSQWCRWETQFAKYCQIIFQNDTDNGNDDGLLMIRLGSISKKHLTPTLKYLMKTRIYLQWDTDPDKQKLFWQKLKYTLATKMGHEENTV